MEHSRTVGKVNVRFRSKADIAPQKVMSAFRGGWIYPGDRGRVTSDGLFILSGRMSDVINVGGIKVAPAAIEALVQQHPAVVEAAAVGSIGADGLEQIVVVIIARPPISAQAVIDWCAERGIVIARVIVVDKLPKTESGKIHCNLIRQLHVN